MTLSRDFHHSYSYSKLHKFQMYYHSIMAIKTLVIIIEMSAVFGS